MLKLKNVSKFYYNKGVVSSGFTKVNLNLHIGEFVVITGESGSGKSTLLNVISGLDTYEEGEMYINGEETSYYGETDFEEYRKKYIANIFQNFNLINSYTVYQNIELIYKLNNIKEDNTKERIDDLLKQVDLYEYRNTKASKLSGGQKQRVAIARALAKDTPIIVADEPTGNLDSKSAKSIIKLLYEISKDKLVIIVTHNYEQVEEYVTRKIKMHDGKIIEDRVIEKVGSDIEYKEKEYGNITFTQKIKLSFRNTFNVIPKFLLLLLVYLFITIAVISEYSSTLKATYDDSFYGFNEYFDDYSDERVIVKKKDGTPFTNDDYTKIENMDNVDYIIKNDLIIDTSFSLTNDDIYIFGNVKDINDFKGSVDVGRMAENDNEVLLVGSKDDYYLSNEDIIDKNCELQNSNTGTKMLFNELKIVGIKYIEASNLFTDNTNIYLSSNTLNDIMKSINKVYSIVESKVNETILKFDYNNGGFNIYPSSKVPSGKALIPDELSYACKNYYCNNNNINILVENIYYTDSIDLVISGTYNKNNFEKLTGLKNYDSHYNEIFINEEDYFKLFDKENYQISIYLKNVKKLDDTLKLLEIDDLSYLHVKDTLVDYSAEIRVFVNLIKFIGIIVALVALFFISYFIIKIILKSRNVYFSTLRILGSSKKDIKTLIILELNNILNISYFIVIAFIILVLNNVIKIAYIKDLVEYLKITDYIVLYIILFAMSLLISTRYSNSLFKSSAMNTYRSEV